MPENIIEVFKELQNQAYNNAIQHGFYEEENAVFNIFHAIVGRDSNLAKRLEIDMLLARLGLIASEVGEAVRAVQHDDMNNLQEELADICIRIFDLCGWQNFDLGTAIQKKMEQNKNRPYKHGKQA